MTDVDHQPTPTVDYSYSPVSEPFWKALADGTLMLPKCNSCSTTFFYPRMFCPHCWSNDVGWAASPGRGVVYTACEVNMPFDGRPADEVPYTVVLVDLDEGVRLAGRLDGPPEETIGARVSIRFGDDPAHSLPFFVLEPTAP